MPRETYCSKCQGMVNGNGCDQEKCEVNDGKGYRDKQRREAQATKATPSTPVAPVA